MPIGQLRCELAKREVMHLVRMNFCLWNTKPWSKLDDSNGQAASPWLSSHLVWFEPSEFTTHRVSCIQQSACARVTSSLFPTTFQQTSSIQVESWSIACQLIDQVNNHQLAECLRWDGITNNWFAWISRKFSLAFQCSSPISQSLKGVT